METRIQEVLNFWFLPPAAPGFGAARPEWFRKDDQFDQQIRHRFGVQIDQAVGGGLREWDGAGAKGSLARLLLLDQFTRNVYRGTPAAFSGDALALERARQMVATGADRSLPPHERAFVYMPFEHAEDLAMQAQAVGLFETLADETPGFDSMLDYARRHREVIARFGRFPHRNAILQRSSTDQEQVFLRQPGSGF